MGARMQRIITNLAKVPEPQYNDVSELEGPMQQSIQSSILHYLSAVN